MAVANMYLQLVGYFIFTIISGRVIDRATRDGVPFANVYLNNTSLGVATALNGEFLFERS